MCDETLFTTMSIHHNKGLAVKIRLEGPMFDFTVHQDQRNVSNWVDWVQFATLEDGKGNPIQLQDAPELPGLAIRLVCTPAGELYS